MLHEALQETCKFLEPLPAKNSIDGHFYGFTEALHDFEIALRRFDEDRQRSMSLREQFQPFMKVAGNRNATEEEAKAHEEYMKLVSALRFDIRCIYIFAKIAFILFAKLLFEMAGSQNKKWQGAKTLLSMLDPLKLSL